MDSFGMNSLNNGNMHKEFSSTPDLKKNIYSSSPNNLSQADGDAYANKHQPFGAAVHKNSPESNTAKTSNSSSNVNSDLISDHLTDTRLLLNGMDSRVGHQRGYYTLPSRHKKVLKILFFTENNIFYLQFGCLLTYLRISLFRYSKKVVVIEQLKE